MYPMSDIKDINPESVNAVRMLVGFHEVGQMIDDNNNMKKKQNESNKLINSYIELNTNINNTNDESSIVNQQELSSSSSSTTTTMSSSYDESNSMDVDIANVDQSINKIEDVINDCIQLSQDEEDNESNNMKSSTMGSSDTRLSIYTHIETIDGDVEMRTEPSLSSTIPS